MGKRQDSNNRMFLKPSPNEEVKLLQDEKQKLRKLRLQQVREQEKAVANRIRKKFRQKENKELNLLGHELKRKWEDKLIEEKITLENLYLENVAHVGEGHQAALAREDDGVPKVASIEDQIKVAERYKQAMRLLKAEETQREQIQYERNVAKHKAMEIERIRAAKIAALEPPVPDIAERLEMIQKNKYKEKSIDQYSSTYYHVPRSLVERADPNDEQVDARYAAKEEEEKIQNAKEDADRNFSEQMEKARLRHKHARSKLLLQKDHDKLIEELKYFERIDRQRRQDIVSKIPKHVFEPPHRRMEANEERQREIEHAFEDMYMAQTNYMGDVTVAREPFPASPATDDTLDISAEKDDEDAFPKQSWDVGSEKDVSDSLEPSKQLSKMSKNDGSFGAKMEHAKEPENAKKMRPGFKGSSKYPLGRLMKKIDQQRDRWKSNKMKMIMKDDKECHDTESVMSDGGDSEISEGPLTITTENTPSVESAGAVSRPRETLLHPHEEAERTRAAIRGTEGLQNTEIEKQKQLLQQQKLKLQLQQQQVLQEHLQLQFDMLQHGIETKAENGEIDKESFSSRLKDSPKATEEDANDVGDLKKETMSGRFDSVSSGLLSDDGNMISVSDSVHNGSINIAGPQREDTRLFTSQAADSRVDASLGHHEALYSIPESIGDDVFAPLTPITPAPIMGILSQPKPLHIEVPASFHSGSRISADRGQPSFPSSQIGAAHTTTAMTDAGSKHVHIEVPTSSYSSTKIPVDMGELGFPSIQIEAPHTITVMGDPQPTFKGTQPVDEVECDSVYPFSRPTSFFRNQPPVYASAEDSFSRVPILRQELPQMPDPSEMMPPSNFTTIANTFPFSRGQLPGTAQFPDPAVTDTASYLKFYQEQLVEQQDRIREQQQAIQQRQQQRLEQLKQFQERLRSMKSSSRSDHDSPGLTHMSDATAYWRSLIPTSKTSDAGSSSAQDTPSDLETREAKDGITIELVEEKTADHPDTKALSKTRDDATSSSLSRYSSEIVTTRQVDDRVLFPDPSELGLWSDSTIQLSSSDATKTSSGTAVEERGQRNIDKETAGASVQYEFEASSSTISTIKNRSSIDINHSSESVDNKSRTSFDSAPLSTSSLPKSDKSHSSSASDTNNNLLLRMESSFQHFQDMIEEAKTLNEKYLNPNKQTSEGSNEGISVGNLGEKKYAMDGELADLKTSSGDSTYMFPEDNLSALTEKTGIDNARQLKTAKERLEEIQRLSSITDDPDGSYVSEHVSCSDFDPYNAQHNGSNIVVSSSHLRPLASRKGESLTLEPDLPYLMESDSMENEPLYFGMNPDASTRALSIIPEESVIISDDQLSEGVLEDDYHDINVLNTSDSRRDFPKVPGTMVGVNIAMESEQFTQNVSGGERNIDIYSTVNLVEDGVYNSSQFKALVAHEGDKYSFQETLNNLPPPSLTKIKRTEEESPSPKVDRDVSVNWSPFESLRFQNTSLNESVAFSKPSDVPKLQTACSTSPVDSSDSSRRACEVDVSGLSRLSISQEDSSTDASGLSLQEAFKRNQARFIENSKRRVHAAKESRFQNPKPAAFEKPVKKSGKNRSEVSSGDNGRCSISQASSAKGLSSEDDLGSKSSDTEPKINKQDMIARTKRLYQNLPDVRQKQVEKQRDEIYAANRAKAQEFQKQTRERLRKLSEKKTGKKK